MVCTSSKFTAILVVALCVTSTHGSPLTESAYMDIPNVIPLNNDNPAYGGRPSANMAKVMSPRVETMLSRAEIATLTTLESNTTSRRFLERANVPDLNRLEAYFGSGSIEYNFEALKAYSSKDIIPSPWPSSYWPTWQDSINVKWDGPNSQPASEKYARAFGLNVQSFMDTISSYNGVNSNSGARSCSADWQCDSLNDGSKCAKRSGHSNGYCTPTWWGICHAWSPAAILEHEPSCPVEYNGVTFKPFDIKALVTLFYDGASLPVVFMGARENGFDASRDEYGRFIVPARRDISPSLLHIAVCNIMGKFGRSFVADINADYQVWNQPIRRYKIVWTERMSTIQAAQRYFHTGQYPFNRDARSIAYVEMDFTWVNELDEDGPLVSNGRVEEATESRRHKYVLELDGNSNIIGGEWIGESQTNHPDFIWFVTNKPTSGRSRVGLDYYNLQKLLDASAIGNCGGTAPSFGRCGSEATGALKCPNGEYCQPWNPNEYLCRKLDAKCGTQESGIDYWGNDLATVTGLLLPEQCCDKCHATEGCTSYTFINYVTWGDKKPLCFLKSGTPRDKRSNPKAVSATIIRTSNCKNKLWARCGSASVGAECCDTGAYCQPWDAQNFQCMPTPKKCGTMYSGVDFYGDDLKILTGVSPENCCEQCAATNGCKSFSYVNEGTPTCYLKSGTGSARQNVRVVSGLLN